MKKALLAICVFAAGCGACNQPVANPVSPDYPCGTRAHACSAKPLSCCWNSEVCGGEVGSGCPAGSCCYAGETLATGKDGGAGPASKQWSPR
jgi:hypothetical protein